MSDEKIQYSYDDVPYPSTAYLDSHPNYLALVAIMSGMTPPPVERCRVLEIASSDGGNLIPMAYGLPDSQFVGIDLSAEEIETGKARMTEIGLSNLELIQMDIMDFGPEMGKFDYILAHGVFSWVPPPVQDKILSICRDHLTPNGLAYISYNAYPGWHFHNALRDLLLYHTQKKDPSEVRISDARDLMKFMAGVLSTSNNLYMHMLHQLTQSLVYHSDSYVFHDFMEDTNLPMYFYQFMEKATQQELQFVANADFTGLRTRDLSNRAFIYLQEISKDIVQLEQYRDFLTGQTFRQTVLCHQGIELNRVLSPDCITTLQIASSVRPVKPRADMGSRKVVEFQTAEKVSISTGHPLTKTALACLAEAYPNAIPCEELIEIAYARLRPDADSDEGPTDDDIEILKSNLFEAFNHGASLAEIHAYLPKMASKVSERPIASKTAQFEARNAERGRTVVNLRHEHVKLDEMNRHLILAMDGTRDHEALLEVMLDMTEEGQTVVYRDGKPVKGSDKVRKTLAKDLKKRLNYLAKSGLLVG